MPLLSYLFFPDSSCERAISPAYVVSQIILEIIFREGGLGAVLLLGDGKVKTVNKQTA